MGQAALVAGVPLEPVVRVAGFAKRYGKQTAVSGVDLCVKPGEISGLIGPDGSGKSSLMKAVAGVLTHNAGLVEVFGVRIDSERAAERVKGRIGFMPQGLGLNLYPELSVEENIDFFARLRLVPGPELAERKQRLLAVTRLERFRDRPMKNLSGGMKQKLGLVCSLIHEPDLLILDEPTTGVDPVSRRDFWAILADLLRERGITALISTSYMDEATRFHQFSLLFRGRVVAQGTPDAILALVPGQLVELQAEPQGAALARLRRRFRQVNAQGPWLRVLVEGPDGAESPALQVQAALDGIPAHGLRTGEPDLEDAFVALLRHQQLAEEVNLIPVTVGRPTTPARGDEVAIEALELVRDFGRFRAVDRVSFRVAQGEIFGLLGPNGSGKTTVIKMLTGILLPSAGCRRLAGVDMCWAGQAIKEQIGYMSQAFSLYQDLTVVENIRLYAGIYGLEWSAARERTDWVIQMAGLMGHEGDHAGRLPMGLRQRLALGCALVHRPQMLFLDEPTSGVDPIGRQRFWDILYHLSRAEGVAILVSTHYMREADYCDHLALMYAGRLVADASPSEMKRQVEQQAGRLMEAHADDPLAALGLLRQAGFEGVGLFGKRIHLLAPDPQDAERRIGTALAAGGVRLLGVEERPLTMEDVFVYRVLALEKQEGGAS